jgi:hypothetical protein
MKPYNQQNTSISEIIAEKLISELQLWGKNKKIPAAQKAQWDTAKFFFEFRKPSKNKVGKILAIHVQGFVGEVLFLYLQQHEINATLLAAPEWLAAEHFDNPGKDGGHFVYQVAVAPDALERFYGLFLGKTDLGWAIFSQHWNPSLPEKHSKDVVNDLFERFFAAILPAGIGTSTGMAHAIKPITQFNPDDSLWRQYMVLLHAIDPDAYIAYIKSLPKTDGIDDPEAWLKTLREDPFWSARMAIGKTWPHVFAIIRHGKDIADASEFYASGADYFAQSYAPKNLQKTQLVRNFSDHIKNMYNKAYDENVWLIAIKAWCKTTNHIVEKPAETKNWEKKYQKFLDDLEHITLENAIDRLKDFELPSPTPSASTKRETAAQSRTTAP